MPRGPLRALLFAAAAALACKNAASPTSAATAGATCPPCECTCMSGGAAPADSSARIAELLDSATKKMNARDGQGCLADLAEVARLDPKAAERAASTQGMCLMLAGRCEDGKARARAALGPMMAQWGPEPLDRTIDAYVAMYCEGTMSDRDALLRALMRLQQGAYMTRKDVAFCSEAADTVERLRGAVQPRDEDDRQIIDVDRAVVASVPGCFQRAGDCERAWNRYRRLAMRANAESYGKLPPAQLEQVLRSGFEGVAPRCKAP